MLRALLAAVLLTLPAFPQKNLAGENRTRIALEKLTVTGRILMIAAHPDDENTALLALMARGRKYQTAYLSLTRGEGGQNLIGSEQGELLGVIRTQELLAARRIDGAQQFFTRAIDFGFTKTAAETFTKWDRERILGDTVYVIRRFQPDVIVLRFSGTPRDGHGQHQASAILGREAFRAAADPMRFPEQLQYVKPWQAKRLVVNLPNFNRAQTQEAEQSPNTVSVDLGEYSPVLGYSYGEIAGMSRSQHRSQAMGAREDRGSNRNYFLTIEGDPAKQDLFDGIDTTWNRMPNGAAAARLFSEAAKLYEPRDPRPTISKLLEARKVIDANRLAEVDEAIADCLGLFLDASAEKDRAMPGSELPIQLQAVNRSAVNVEWTATSITGSGASSEFTPKTTALADGRVNTETVSAALPSSAPLSQPYWLELPRKEAQYVLPYIQLLNLPDSPAPLRAVFKLRVAGEAIEIRRPVAHRFVDRMYGETVDPLVITPPVTLQLEEKALLFPSAAARQVSVEVSALEPANGTIALELPGGWRSEPASQAFAIADPAETRNYAFRVTPPSGDATGVLRAVATLSGKPYSHSSVTIDFSHIPKRTVFFEAAAKLVRADVRILSKNIGYVMGAGDQVPQALRQLGCTVTLLSSEDLMHSDLGRFDAIITGVRAFNTREDLRANIQRVYDYAGKGGTVVVQYNVAERGFFGSGGNPSLLEHVGPYPITVSNDRVTVEDSKVHYDDGHPLYRVPNRISDADFEGWVQERGLYFASKWDSRYTSLLSMSDPGEKPLAGGTLYTPYGKGAYIFTPLSWFRQLPAGVPGAYRIFANLLSAGKAAR